MSCHGEFVGSRNGSVTEFESDLLKKINMVNVLIEIISTPTFHLDFSQANGRGTKTIS